MTPSGAVASSPTNVAVDVVAVWSGTKAADTASCHWSKPMTERTLGRTGPATARAADDISVAASTAMTVSPASSNCHEQMRVRTTTSTHQDNAIVTGRRIGNLGPM